MLCCLLLPASLLMCCGTRSQSLFTEGKVQMTTTFTSPDGDTTLLYYHPVYYRDSMCIQEARGMHFTSYRNKTTFEHPLINYVFIDLRKMVIADFHTLTDTAEPYNIGVLRDTILKRAYWNFNSYRYRTFAGEPVMLADTTVEGITYKRATIRYSFKEPQEGERWEAWFLPYYRGEEFSLEKPFCRRKGWTMVRYYSYAAGQSKPWACMAINYLSDTLTAEQVRIMEVWKKKMDER